ncbi:MAG: hypothetical protein H8D23_30735 [Candidatus Brocadiales bacterium]|nr:hypothetical protein [Candidatus Brocadiales bacterium]
MKLNLCRDIHVYSGHIHLLFLLIYTLAFSPVISTSGRIENALREEATLAIPIKQNSADSATSISSALVSSTTSTVKKPQPGLSYVACLNTLSSEADIQTTFVTDNYTSISIDTYTASNILNKNRKLQI